MEISVFYLVGDDLELPISDMLIELKLSDHDTSSQHFI